MNDEQVKGLEIYEKLHNAFPDNGCYFELNSHNECCFVRIHGIKNLRLVKKVLGIPKLTKENSSDTQYAYGDIGNTHITIFASDVFAGCKIETITEEVLVPATEEHYETVTHKKIICGKAHNPE